jgi:small nuclear ribonucleoprotein (snRNP)-like protein
MAASLRGLTGTTVRVVMNDGSTLVGVLASVDDRLNIALMGARDSALAGTHLERAPADAVRFVRGESVTACFSVDA